MSNYNSIKAIINANVKTNGKQEISGSVLNSVLNAMVNALGAGYQYAGVATPDSNPGTPDTNVVYIAATAGTYAYMGGLAVAEGEVAILRYNGTWTKDVTGAATAEQAGKLGQDVSKLRTEVNHIADFTIVNQNNSNLPNFDESSQTLDFGEDPVFCCRGKRYTPVQIWASDKSKYRAIHWPSPNDDGVGSALILVFNTDDCTFAFKRYSVALAPAECIVGGLRTNWASKHVIAHMPFQFTINSFQGYQFAGIATPTTNPGTPNQNVFYIASESGTYLNFNSLVIPDGSFGILKYNGSWSVQTFGADSIIVRVRVTGASNSAAGIGINRLNGIGWNGTTFALEEGSANFCTVFAVNGSRVYLYNYGSPIIYFRAYDDTGAYIGTLTQQYVDLGGTRYFYADLPSGTAFIIANRFPDRTVKILSQEQFNILQAQILAQRQFDALAANTHIDLSQYSVDNNIITTGGVLLPGYTAKQAIFFKSNSKKVFYVDKNLNNYLVFAYDKDFNFISNFNVSASNNVQILPGIYQITYTIDNVCYLGFSYEKDNGVKRSINLLNWFYIQNLLAIGEANTAIANLQTSLSDLNNTVQDMKKAAQVGDLTMPLIMPMMYAIHGIDSPTTVAQFPVVSATSNSITLSSANAAAINKDMLLVVQFGTGNNATFGFHFFKAASGNVITLQNYESVDLSTATVVMSTWDTAQGQNGMHLSCLGYKAYAHSVVGLLNRYSMIDKNQVKGVDMTTCALAHAWNNPSVYDNDGNLILTPTISGLQFGGHAWENIARSCVIGRNNNIYNGTNGWRNQAFYIVQNNAGYIEFPLENINAYGFLAIEAGCCDNRFQPTRDTAVIGGATMTVYNNDTLIHTETIEAGNMRRIIIDNIQAGTIKVRFTLTAVPTCLSIYSLRFYNLFAETLVPSLENKKIAVLGDSWTQFPLTTDSTVTPEDPFNTVVTRPDGTQGGGYGYFPKELARITGASVDNWGKSGETSEWALTQIDAILAYKVYDYIIIEFGLNDRNGSISVEQWKTNLTTMANKAKLRGVRPIILAPTVTNAEGQSVAMGEWFENLMNGLI